MIGGLLIGCAAALLLLGRGQIAGISGIVGNTLFGNGGTRQWRWWFLVGFFVAPIAVWLVVHVPTQYEVALPTPLLIASGLLVGFGTRLGNGCTSGHGVCGLGNLSQRSLVAVLVFMGVAALTAYVYRHVMGHVIGAAS
ncbi:MAG: YeeE/YedE family protein [Solimonas sp.]